MPVGFEVTDETIQFFLRVARRMARQWCESGADFEDVAQEAVIRLLSQPRAPDNAVAWLYVVTRRLTHRQRRRRASQLLAEETFARRALPSPDPDVLLDLSSLVSQLGTRDRRLLTRVVEGALSAELAAEFRCNVRDVGQMVARARRRARRARDDPHKS